MYEAYYKYNIHTYTYTFAYVYALYLNRALILLMYNKRNEKDYV